MAEMIEKIETIKKIIELTKLRNSLRKQLEWVIAKQRRQRRKEEKEKIKKR